jgi:sarcosine oxidase subunit gamma
MLKHMNVGLARTGPDRFEIIAFRSMAKTLVHDLETAMKDVAARP